MAKTTLVIARHGNTFNPGETPTRVGARTDLTLVESGYAQAELLGNYLAQEGPTPHFAFSSTLKRATETARVALSACGSRHRITELSQFDEIDYGPDENKSEQQVLERVGAAALRAWDEEARVPPGWIADPQKIIKNWQQFAQDCIEDRTDKITLVVTSNGVARFAPHITGNFDSFRSQHSIKLRTGSLGVLVYETGLWKVERWDVRLDS